MRTFYIFEVNDEYYKLTKNLPFNLYMAYLNIRMSTKSNAYYLYHEYLSFTLALNKDKTNSYLKLRMDKLDGYTIYNNVHMYNNYYTDEVSKLIVKSTYMILKSNRENSTFFTVLKDIPNVFVIDFENKDYFWLASFCNLRLVYEH